MATVFLPSQMRDLTGGVVQVDSTGTSLAQILDELEARFPGIRERLCDEDGLQPGLQISIDNTSTRKLSTKVESNSEIHFLPAIGGG